MKNKSVEKTVVATSWKRSLLVFVLSITVFCFCGCGGKISPPLTITFRESMLNSTRVMQLTNRSANETLVVQVLVRDKANNNEHSYITTVAPGATEEVGYLQAGFNFVAGEKYEVSCDGYFGTSKGVVP